MGGFVFLGFCSIKGGMQAKDPEENIWAQENGEWRRLHSLYRSPNIVRVIKSRRLRWTAYVARMEEECFQNFNR